MALTEEISQHTSGLGKSAGLSVNLTIAVSKVIDQAVDDNMLAKLALHVISTTPLLTGFQEVVVEVNALPQPFREPLEHAKWLLEKQLEIVNDMLAHPNYEPEKNDGAETNTHH